MQLPKLLAKNDRTTFPDPDQ
jgi:hypothetical protein